MRMILTQKDFARLGPAARNELLALWQASTAPIQESPAPSSAADDPRYAGVDMEHVADLSPDQVEEWMKGAHEKTEAGLRFFAEHGPIVDAVKLQEAGVENLRHFQSRTTTRTRTVTGDKNAFLLSWDTWKYAPDNPERVISGRYMVSPTTYASLRKYFGLG